MGTQRRTVMTALDGEDDYGECQECGFEDELCDGVCEECADEFGCDAEDGDFDDDEEWDDESDDELEEHDDGWADPDLGGRG